MCISHQHLAIDCDRNPVLLQLQDVLLQGDEMLDYHLAFLRIKFLEPDLAELDFILIAAPVLCWLIQRDDWL